MARVMRVLLLELLLVVAVALLLNASSAQSPEPAMAPSPTSDGVTIDQGIAYLLMLAALVVTYIIH
ncbi:hypothetical protein Syun_011369 [Stephania yunnanensis]|uniref:Uncharacterized protein n=1 Tax=Stephania yunnanensis TaxID=152371 RepID=A0AAP0PGE4_9MAGN